MLSNEQALLDPHPLVRAQDASRWPTRRIPVPSLVNSHLYRMLMGNIKARILWQEDGISSVEVDLEDIVSRPYGRHIVEIYAHFSGIGIAVIVAAAVVSYRGVVC